MEHEFDEFLLKSLTDLYQWVKKENYEGWDPYDGLNNKKFQQLNSNLLKILIIQFNLYSPINLRPFLDVKKGISNKGIALFAEAYLNLYCILKENHFLKEANRLLEYLEEKSIDKNGLKCWSSFYFKYQFKKHRLGPSIPDIVGTTIISKLFIRAYQISGKEKYFKIAKSSIDYLLRYLLNSNKLGKHFKYTPFEKEKIVPNVSGLSLSSFSKFIEEDNNNNIINIGEDVVRFLIQVQDEKGYWIYSFNNDLSPRYKQIDFHQGFILDGLINFLPHIQDENLKTKAIESIYKGFRFYRTNQFTQKGISYYRYPSKYPVDIHNQAQGIITSCNIVSSQFFDEIKRDAKQFSMKIASWTIKNMQSDEGYFYSHKWPFLTNKIPYMRWSQAWMTLALTSLLENVNK